MDYISAQEDYDNAADPETINELYEAAVSARQAAIDGNANLNLALGGGLAAVGIGLGVLSAVLFNSQKKTGEDSFEAALLPYQGGALLAFHVSY